MELDGFGRAVKPRAVASGAHCVAHVFQLGLGKALLAAFVVVVLHAVVQRLALLFGQPHARAHAVWAPAVFAVVAKQARI